MLVSLLAGLIALPAVAHDTWLLAAHIDGKKKVRLELTSGMQFPRLEYGPKADRVERAWGRVDEADVVLGKPRQKEKALRFPVPAVRDAAGVFAIQLKPKTLDLDLAEVDHYLDEIHATDALRQRWAAQPEPRRWREEYVKNAKALLPGKDGSCTSVVPRPLGLKLELQPEADPCVAAGQSLSLRVLRDGAPFPGLSVALVDAQGREVGAASSDGQGRLRLAVPRSGLWLLRATALRPAEAAGLDWQSEFTTLTFSAR